MKVLLMTSYSGIGFNNAPSLGLYRLKNFLNKTGLACDILDLGLTGYAEALRKARNGEYRIIGMSVSHYHMREDISIIWKFKEACAGQECLFIAGGQEATYNYEQWIKVGIDVVFMGYAERSLAQLARNFNTRFERGLSLLDTLDGVAYRQGDEIVYRPCKPMTQSEFEYLTYEEGMGLNIPFGEYWNQVRADVEALNFWTTVFIPETVRLYTASHCPYRCGFCSSHRFLSFSQRGKAPIFMLNADQVFNLILQYIQKYGAKGFLFSDDEFLVSEERAMSLFDRVIKAKKDGIINKDVAFNCQARVSDFLLKTGGRQDVHYELIDKMVEAGFHSIGMGVETFCDRLLMSPSMNKRGFTGEASIRVINAMLEGGLVPQINNILFIPEATREEITYSIRKSINFIRKGCQVAVTPLLYSIPGAPIYGDPRYLAVTEEYKNPETNEFIEITKHFIPNDPEMARCADWIFDALDEELDAFKKSGIWKHKTIPKTMVGILLFTATAKLFGDAELAKECADLIRFLIKNRKPH